MKLPHLVDRSVLTLTAWYAGVILVISVSFSAVVYGLVQRELGTLERRYQNQAQQLDQVGLPTWARERIQTQKAELERGVEEARNRWVMGLMLVNIGVGVGGAVLAYFLALRSVQPLADAAERQRRFAANAAHELRTPLAVMRSELDVSLRETKLTTQEARATLESTREEVIRLQRVTEGLLRLATHTDAEIRETFREVEISELLTTVEKRMQGYAASESVSLSITPYNGQVYGNAELLTELFVILVENSIRYRRSTNAEVDIEVKPTEKGLLFSVADNGIGVEKERIPQLFTYAPDRTRQGSAKGYGLGLPLAGQLVELHQGSITVRSAVGVGTEVTVVIPAHG